MPHKTETQYQVWRNREAVNIYEWFHTPFEALNIRFMMTVVTLILVFIWSFERGTKQLMQLEPVKIQSTDWYKRNNTELIFWTCLACQMTANSFINKNITAKLHFLPKFSRDSGMSLSMHYVSRAWHSMAGDVIGKTHLALHAEGLTFSFFKLCYESTQSRCHPDITHVHVTLFVIWGAFLKVFLLSDLAYYFDLWFHPSVKIIVLGGGDIM